MIYLLTLWEQQIEEDGGGAEQKGKKIYSFFFFFSLGRDSPEKHRGYNFLVLTSESGEKVKDFNLWQTVA